MPSSLFFVFNDTVPDAKTCLKQVYDIFAPYKAQRGFCRQCFTPEQEEQICAPSNVRGADYTAFAGIYFEHPNCSGGLATFRHWLPRALECAGIDTRPSPPLPDQIARLGLLSWPQAEQDALRNVFTRAALNWFITGDPSPLGRQWPADMTNRLGQDIWTAEILVSALIYLRIDPASLAKHMLATDTTWTSLGLAAGFGRPWNLEYIGYLVLEGANDEAAMRSAFVALDRRARADFHRHITYDVLLSRWEAAEARGDDALATHLLWAMENRDPLELTEQERDADEALLAGIVCV